MTKIFALWLLLWGGLAFADVFVIDGQVSLPLASSGSVRITSGNGGPDSIEAIALYQGPFGSVTLVKPDGATSFYEATNHSDRARGNAFTSAYAAAESGDTLILSEGIFNAHDPAYSPAGKSHFLLNKTGLTIFGQGQPTAFDARMVFLATNNILQNLAFTNSFHDDVLVFYGNATSTHHYSAFRDIWIYANTGSAHAVEFSGSGLLIENVHSFVPPGGIGHPFVLKGVSNVVVRNCSSTGGQVANGLLIKTSTDGGFSGKNLVSDVLVDGFLSDGPGTALRIAPDDNQSLIQNVTIRNFFARNVSLSGLYMGATGSSLINNRMTNVVIDGITTLGPLTSGSIQIFASYGSFEVHNAYLSSVVSPVVLNATLPYPVYTLKSVYLSNRRVDDVTVWKRTSPDSSIGASTFSLAYLERLSLGLNATYVRTMFANTNALELTITWPSAYAVFTNNWIAGDPVWVASGTFGGVHRLKSWGQTWVTNTPVLHAGTGDYFAVVEYFGTNVGTAASLGVTRFGKVFADIPYQAAKLTYARPLLEVKTHYTQNFYNMRHFRSYVITLVYGAAGDVPTVYHNQLDAYTAAGGELTLFPRCHFYDDSKTNLYLSVFGDFTAITSLYGNAARFFDITTELKISGTSSFIDSVRLTDTRP